jgi:hypothetical protein
MTFEEVRSLLLALPGVEEGSSYGTPGFRVRGKFLTRLKEDGTSLVVKVGLDERDMLIEAAPDSFYLTDHYRPHPYMLVRLARVDPGTLRRLLIQSWRTLAPKAMIKAFDAAEQG